MVIEVVLHHYFCVNFSFRSNLMEYVLPEMVQKTMDLHVLHNFKISTTISTSFIIYMFKGGVDTFA
jgi:hypothetical protein